MIGQAFQIEEVKGKTNTYNIKYNTKNGGSKYDETLCVNYPTNGGTLQLYKCKKNDAHSEWTYQGKKLMVKAFGECMATEGSSQSSLSNSNYVEGMWCCTRCCNQDTIAISTLHSHTQKGRRGRDDYKGAVNEVSNVGRRHAP